MGDKFAAVVIPPRESRAERKRRLRLIAELTRPEVLPAPPKVDLGPMPKVWGDPTKKRSWWGPTRVDPKTHRASSLVSSTAYPFLSEVGLGHRGVWMGKLGTLSGGGDFVFDPFELYAQKYITGTSMVWLGTVGTGKSSGAKSFATRIATHGVKIAVASDPKGEWVPVGTALGGVVISLGPSSPNRLNPLDEGPRDSRLSDAEWVGLVRSRRRLILTAIIPTLIGRDLRPEEHTALDIALSAAVASRTDGVVTITDVYSAVTEPTGPHSERTRAEGIDLAHGLRRLVIGDLAGVFNGESTVSFDPDAPIVVMDTSGFMGASGTLLSVATTCVAAWLEAAVMDPDAGKRVVIYDEGWRMLRDEMMLLRMSEQWKLARQYGLCNLLIMHRLTDLDMVGEEGSAARNLAKGLLTDSEIRIVYRQEEDVLALTKKDLGLTDAEIREVRSLNQGVGLWKIGDRPFIVRNNLTESEKEVFKTSDRFEMDLPDVLREAGEADGHLIAAPATPSGWVASKGEVSAEEEYRDLERTRQRVELKAVREQIVRDHEENEEWGAVAAERQCPKAEVHEATGAGKFCSQCGAQRRNAERAIWGDPNEESEREEHNEDESAA